MSKADWVAEVKSRLVYNYKSETVHWRNDLALDQCGQRINECNHSGYRVTSITFAGRQRRIHRIVWVLVHGEDAKGYIDHLDGDKANNAHWNLRDVDNSTNGHNNAAKGYHWNKLNGKWCAQITINRKGKYLGSFNTEEEARAAYEAAKKLHGFIHR